MRRRNRDDAARVSASVSSSGTPSTDDSRTLEGVAVAITVLLAANALAEELAPLWQAICLLFDF